MVIPQSSRSTPGLVVLARTHGPANGFRQIAEDSDSATVVCLSSLAVTRLACPPSTTTADREFGQFGCRIALGCMPGRTLGQRCAQRMAAIGMQSALGTAGRRREVDLSSSDALVLFDMDQHDSPETAINRGAFATATDHWLDETSWITRVPQFLTGHDVLLRQLSTLGGWEQRRRWMR